LPKALDGFGVQAPWIWEFPPPSLIETIDRRSIDGYNDYAPGRRTLASKVKPHLNRASLNAPERSG
jgi:hypothetical protein